MRNTLSLVAVGSVLLALGACGDDGDTGSGGGTTTSTGGSGTGASGTGGEGGGVALKADGDNCMTDAECDGGVCIVEEFFGWAGGYCTRLCDPMLAPCGPGAACLKFSDASSGCFKECEAKADCTGTAQSCADVSPEQDGSVEVCLGGCQLDNQCKIACNADNLTCAAADEVCDNTMDDDLDLGDTGFIDCEDADCFTDTTCEATVSGACTAAEDVSAGGTFSGNTSTGTNAFATLCPGFFGDYLGGTGGNEKIFKFTATEVGTVTFDVTTSTGAVDWYLRTTCELTSSSLGFCGDQTSGAAGLPVNAGDTVFLFVDGFGGDAAYDLDVSFAALAPVCAGATTITLGDTNGNTSTGQATAAMSSTCGGGGSEIVYTYTPAATGMLNLTLASATDQGLHVRTDCLDSATQIGCADSQFGGTNETLMVPVTSGTPITITVDAFSAGEEGVFTLTLAQP